MNPKVNSMLTVLAIFTVVHQAAAQGTTAFTYQGQLHDTGTNANGTYSMIYTLYDSLNIAPRRPASIPDEKCLVWLFPQSSIFAPP
jgi:hypothetical protein